MYFGGEGSQGGLLQEINGDGILDVGDKSQTAGGNATNWVKPRSATAVWDDANYDTGTSDASGHEVYQYVSSPNIIIGRSSLVPGTTANSVSFYLGLMQYHVTSATLGHGVEFSPVVPTFTDLGGLVPANWWESNPDENQQNGTQVPNTSGPNGTSTNYLAGTSVEILGFSTINPFPPHTIIALTNASGGTVFGTLLTNAASPTAGSATATFNPNAPLANRINVLGSNGSYVPGYANNVGGGDTGGGGDATDTVEATGWNPATDTEIYAMKLLVGGEAPTPAQINRIISDINNSNNGLAVTASGNNGALAGLFSGYQILISTSGVGATGDEYLAWDFSLETNVVGVTVEDIAAIPEPSSALLSVGRFSGNAWTSARRDRRPVNCPRPTSRCGDNRRLSYPSCVSRKCTASATITSTSMGSRSASMIRRRSRGRFPIGILESAAMG